MGALKGLDLAEADQVLIKRDGEYARIIFKERPFEGGMNLQLGEKIKDMSDADILRCYNEVVLSMMVSVAEYRPLEIADGYPQVKFDRKYKEWSSIGQVLRCEIEDDEEGRVGISIDGKVLSFSEFEQIISSYRGWAMRIEFMDASLLTSPPEPKIVKRPPRVKL